MPNNFVQVQRWSIRPIEKLAHSWRILIYAYPYIATQRVQTTTSYTTYERTYLLIYFVEMSSHEHVIWTNKNEKCVYRPTAANMTSRPERALWMKVKMSNRITQTESHNSHSFNLKRSKNLKNPFSVRHKLEVNASTAVSSFSSVKTQLSIGLTEVKQVQIETILHSSESVYRAVAPPYSQPYKPRWPKKCDYRTHQLYQYNKLWAKNGWK